MNKINYLYVSHFWNYEASEQNLINGKLIAFNENFHELLKKHLLIGYGWFVYFDECFVG